MKVLRELVLGRRALGCRELQENGERVAGLGFRRFRRKSLGTLGMGFGVTS